MLILYGLFCLSFVDNASFPKNDVFGDQGPSPIGWGGVNLWLSDCYFFCSMLPVMFILDYFIGASSDLGAFFANNLSNNIIDILLVLLTVVIMQSFRSFESKLLIIMAFIGQYFMLHSCDLVSFYICLEIQNFCFMVLCGLQPRALLEIGSSCGFSSSYENENVGVATNGVTPNKRCTPNNRGLPTNDVCWEKGSGKNGKYKTGRRPLAGVEASIKYLLLSAFASGFLLFWFSVLYLRTGITTLSWGPLTATPFDTTGASYLNDSDSFVDIVPQMLILIALMFKLGGAPLHLWMIDIYSGVKRQLLMYISTAPKLSLFGFWVSTWHSVWTDLTVLMFVAFSMIIGCFGAYNQPTLRSLFAYSTVNEIGLMLMAIETAGFHSLYQHLTIYIVTMLLLWNNSDKRLFAILAISLAGLPPLAGFFGKAWIFNSVATGGMAGPYIGILIISLFCTGLSLVYYLRVFRLFTMTPLLTGISYSASVSPQPGDSQQTASSPKTPFLGNGKGSTPFVGGSVFVGKSVNLIMPDSNANLIHNMSVETRTYGYNAVDFNIKLTSFCVIFLIFAPLFYIKPFVL